jgi:hypothetical protein
MKSKSILTIAIAAATIAVGSLSVIGEASARKGGGGFHGGRHGGHGHVHRGHGRHGHGHRWHGHRWHGHRWHGRYFYGYSPVVYGGYAAYDDCYFARKPSGRLVKVCPSE